jgi:hypothetical protein
MRSMALKLQGFARSSDETSTWTKKLLRNAKAALRDGSIARSWQLSQYFRIVTGQNPGTKSAHFPNAAVYEIQII